MVCSFFSSSSSCCFCFGVFFVVGKSIIFSITFKKKKWYFVKMDICIVRHVCFSSFSSCCYCCGVVFVVGKSGILSKWTFALLEVQICKRSSSGFLLIVVLVMLGLFCGKIMFIRLLLRKQRSSQKQQKQRQQQQQQNLNQNQNNKKNRIFE